MAGIKLEDLQKMIAEGVAQAMATHAPAKRRVGRPTMTDEEKAKRKSNLEAEVIKAFTEAGYKDVQPRVNVMTYNKWLEHGRRVKKGASAIRCGSFGLFHVDQTEPLVVPKEPEPETTTDDTVH